MRFNLVDIAVLAYMGYAVWMGRRRGMAKEVPWALGWLVALFTGSGIYRWTTRGLEQASQATGITFGIFGFLVILIGGYLMVLKLRARIRTILEKKYPDSNLQKTGGMIAGGLRALWLSSVLILFVMLLPVGFLREPFQKGSLVGRMLNRIVLPVVKLAQDEEPPPQPVEPRTNAPPKRPPHDPTRSKQF